MSFPVAVAILLVVAGLVLGLLPERHCRVPALPLLVLAPGLILWIAALHGLGTGLLWTVALAALYRGPLIYWLRSAFGIGRRNGSRQAG